MSARSTVAGLIFATRVGPRLGIPATPDGDASGPAVLPKTALDVQPPGLPLSGDLEPSLKNFAVVIGHGRVGGAVAERLRRAGCRVAVLDADLHVVQHLRGQGLHALYGDASYPTVLKALHLGNALLIVVALPDAPTTRAVVTELRRSKSNLPILARAARVEDEESLRLAGATSVIVPEQAGAELLANEALAVLEERVRLARP